MKVRCINRKWYDLTEGKIYDVISTSWIQGKKAYYIRNDKGSVVAYYMPVFEEINDDIEQPTFTDFTQFPIGTEVFCMKRGQGKLMDTKSDICRGYPIRCIFGSSIIEYYDENGFLEKSHVLPSLFIKGHEPKNFYVEPPESVIKKEHYVTFGKMKNLQ